MSPRNTVLKRNHGPLTPPLMRCLPNNISSPGSPSDPVSCNSESRHACNTFVQLYSGDLNPAVGTSFVDFLVISSRCSGSPSVSSDCFFCRPWKACWPCHSSAGLDSSFSLLCASTPSPASTGSGPRACLFPNVFCKLALCASSVSGGLFYKSLMGKKLKSTQMPTYAWFALHAHFLLLLRLLCVRYVAHAGLKEYCALCDHGDSMHQSKTYNH